MASKPARICTVVLLSLLVLQGIAGADRTYTRVMFPGWRITTSEDAWANEELRKGMKHYPISNLVDGDLTTAWVFEGPKGDAAVIEHNHIRSTGAAFGSGVSEWIEFEAISPDAPMIDAVGIVNGYAKSPAIYMRNNRVTRIRVDGGGSSWKPEWTKSADIQQVMWTQVIPVPETRGDRVRITVEAVERGEDNDLCISELQLYHRGQAVLPVPPPHMLYSAGSDCGCGDTGYLVDLLGRPTHEEGLFAECYWPILAFSKEGRRIALSSRETGGLVVADVRTGRTLYEASDVGHVTDVEWTSRTEVRIAVWLSTARAKEWWELDLATPHPEISRVEEVD